MAAKSAVPVAPVSTVASPPRAIQDFPSVPRSVVKLYGGLHLARWVIGTLIAVAVLVLWRLPAILPEPEHPSPG